MSEKTRTYEGMFVVEAGKDFETASEPIQNVLARSNAEIVSIKPWDERRLAYDIRGRKRGLYILTYFKADPLRVSEIEHDCNLNEGILRALILKGDHLTDEQIQAETPATATAAAAAAAAAPPEEPGEQAPAPAPEPGTDPAETTGGEEPSGAAADNGPATDNDETSEN